jgi:hypothetical protein
MKLAHWVALCLSLVMVASCGAKAEDFDSVRITPQICNYVETASDVSLVKISLGHTDDSVNAWADHEIAESFNNKELYVAWSMVREATAFIRKQYESDEIAKMAKALPKYTKVELVGIRMKQLCAANEAKGTIYKVPKELTTKGFDS